MSDTAPNRYGWRVWGITPDHVLRSPFGGSRAERNPAISHCITYHRNRIAADCGCGVHYIPDTRRFLDPNWATGAVLTAARDEHVDLGSEYVDMRYICIGITGFAISFGIALGQVERDWMNPSAKGRYRTSWYHMLQLMVVDDDPDLSSQLRERYECPVDAVEEFTVDACLPVAQRLRGIEPSADMRQLDAPMDHFALPCPEPPPGRSTVSGSKFMQVLEERMPAEVFARVAGRQPKMDSVPTSTLVALLSLGLPPLPAAIDPTAAAPWW